MIDRQQLGVVPAKPHTVFRAPDGRIVYEEMFTRRGFSGAFTYFYHLEPITAALEVGATDRGFAQPRADDRANEPLRRRLYQSDRVPFGGQAIDRRTPILFNRDLALYLARPSETDDSYFANGDGDELWFVESGTAKLESCCGWLEIKAGDYVFVPRSLMHRWHVTSQLSALVIEAYAEVAIPEGFRNSVGQLKMDAPYTHRDFGRPVGPVATFGGAQDGPRALIVKKGNKFYRYVLERPPMDVIGWDGFVYPWTFPIEKYQPKVGLVHLPPTIHTTFAGPGFVVCSFVPRVVDFHPQAVPCPYPHSSVDCDEVLFYLRGNFTSRRGVGPGAISLHPAGIAHGPHPGAYEKSIGTQRTDELAVMLDTALPLQPTAQAANIEDLDYHESWLPADA